MKRSGMNRRYLPIGLLAAGLAVATAIAVLVPQRSSAIGSYPDAPWTLHIVRADNALAAGDVRAAKMAWVSANGEALRSGAWDAMVAVGDAALRIGHVAGSRRASEPLARQAYLTALFRARSQRSLEGIFRATEAFANLGDLEVVGQCLRIAEDIARRAPDRQAQTHLVAFRERLNSRFLGMASPSTGLF